MPNKQADATPDDPFGYAPAWRPDKQGDIEFVKFNTASVLEGAFTDVNEGFSDYGEYPIVVITDDNGEQFAWHAMTEVARTQLVKAEPEIGQRLRIAYGGKKESKTPGHEPYTRWSVRNLSTSPEDRAKSILGKFSKHAAAKSPHGDFDDDPPF